MVATFVEIIVGIRLTDQEACQFLLNMNEEDYNKYKDECDGTSVFVNTNNYRLPGDFQVFKCICCSDTTDVIVGISLRKIFRIKKRCEKCKQSSLCNDCFNTTEQGIINYDETYSFKYKLKPYEVCNFCNSYNKNGKEGSTCITCFRDLEPYNDTRYISKILQKELGIKRDADVYFHWDDCCSCT